jgi:cyclohexanone monooxygenase
VKHANSLVEGSMLVEANSWFVGANIPGKARAILLYANPAQKFRAKVRDVAAKGYEGFVLR